MDDDNNNIQGLLVVNCCPQITPTHGFINDILKQLNGDNDGQYVAKSINFGADASADQRRQLNDIHGYGVRIDNKYYSANVHLFDIVDKHLINQKFADCVEGVIVYYDFDHDDTCFDVLQSWQSFIDQFNNEIKLLVCNSIDYNCGNSSDKLMKWCLDNEFELVDLNPNTDDDDDDNDTDADDGRLEPFGKQEDGIVRITQAIHAHTWPYSSLKASPQYKPSDKFKDLLDKEVTGIITDDSDSPLKIDDNFGLVDNDMQCFSNLFAKFNDMKVKASQLSETDRKKFAEDMTIAFWKAIDGDEEDIEGLDDDI
ncbi:alpha- and gamma-adaptin-binding protein p34-like [Oppia nitens]|uniref:alpha- and gamma-adaptin-binding protein p34-like n=1 Tax=Oppia nitens TaxID=1686743 RepID=UPI0023DB8534|nr:alpha- and gamma-adaptin-binding protein p34-like [Oppia nitens]